MSERADVRECVAGRARIGAIGNWSSQPVTSRYNRTEL